MMNFNIKAAFRNAKRNGVLSFAKLFGISISFAVILFSAGYVFFETSFDKFIPDHDKIFLLLMEGKLNDQDVDFAVTSPMMAEAVVNDIPEIEEAVRLMPQGNATIHYNEKAMDMGQLLFADSNFFSFFSLPIEKTRPQIFESENNIAIARSLALQYFGSIEGALNQVVSLRESNCVITGVFDDFPENFHLQYKLVQSIAKTNPENIGWGSQSYITYIKTNTSTINNDDFDFKISKCVYSHFNDGVDGAMASSWEDLKSSESNYILYSAEPLTKVHFSNHKFSIAVTSNKIYVYGAVILSILVLLISSINYVNLTISNISTRYKEIGIRKTNGAGTNHIAMQFLYESIAFWIIGFLFAVLLYYFAAKPLSSYLQLNIHLSNINLIKLVCYSFIILLVFNLLTNTFPIFYISNKKILNLVKEGKSGRRNFSARNGFMLVQFALSAFIILSSIIVQKQVNFMVNNNRGYNGDNVLMLSLWDLDESEREVFINEMKAFTSIKNISTSQSYFGSDPTMTGARFEKDSEENFFHTSVLSVDAEFTETFDLEMVEGRFFDQNKITDLETVIINEAALKEYSGNNEIVGNNLFINGFKYKIIGVVDDFNYRSLHHKVTPLVLVNSKVNPFAFIKIDYSQLTSVLSFLNTQWQKFNIKTPFAFEFHDDVVARSYVSDLQAKKLLLILSIISILIACVGLYAISAFTILKRTKEIGVRKVNGANEVEVMAMLTKDFTVWVVTAFVIAAPLAYLAMNKWLQNFAFKTELNWWVFIITGVIVIGIALLTVSWQTHRAARRNPVEALRYE